MFLDKMRVSSLRPTTGRPFLVTVQHAGDNPHMIVQTYGKPSFLRARLIQGITYNDARVFDERASLHFDLLRAMFEVDIGLVETSGGAVLPML